MYINFYFFRYSSYRIRCHRSGRQSNKYFIDNNYWNICCRNYSAACYNRSAMLRHCESRSFLNDLSEAKEITVWFGWREIRKVKYLLIIILIQYLEFTASSESYEFSRISVDCLSNLMVLNTFDFFTTLTLKFWIYISHVDTN